MPEPSLKNLPVFKDLDEERLARLEACLEEESFGPNEVVFRSGDPGDGLYLVAEGGVVLRSEVPGQPVERVRDVLAGGLFGDMEEVDSGRRLFSARTLGDTVLYRIPQEHMEELLNDGPLEAALGSLLVRRRESLRRAPSTRLEPRFWVDRDVHMTLENGRELYLRIENLSWSGACFGAAPEDWQVTRPLRFALGAGKGPALLRASGVVRWRQGDSAGIAFDAAGPAHRRRVAKALRALTPG
jgi:CRP-like cAMP-binding protein